MVNLQVREIAVIGSGTMGHGIAEVAAISGFSVHLNDLTLDILQRALNNIRWSLDNLHRKGQLKEEPSEVMSRISVTTSLEDAVKNADFIIEAVFEDFNVKSSIFRRISEYAPPHAILASNTSSIPISELASVTNRPDKVIGMHFFNPPVLMKLIEVVRGDRTSDETVNVTVELGRRLGKEPVVVNKDVPGFISNRVFMRLIEAACLMVTGNEATIEAIDSAARFKLGLPMGVFELIDFVGIDVVNSILKAMVNRGFRFSGCGLIDERVKEGKLGLKTGEGFYKYPEVGKYSRVNVPKEAGEGVNPVRLIALAVNEAAWLIRSNVASAVDVDTVTKLGFGFPKGLLEYADSYGIGGIMVELIKLKEKYGTIEVDPLIMQMVAEGNIGVKAGSGFHQYGGGGYETIKLTIEPPIAWITLNRPEKLNAINRKMISELMEVINRLEAEPFDRVRVIVIRGAGKAFSAGADLTMFSEEEPTEAYLTSRMLQELTNKLETLNRPVIAMIHGYALGGGLELALACDLRIASEDAVLGLPEVTLGLIPGSGGAKRLVRLIGLGKAKELILTGARLNAREAEELGIVNRVVPISELENETKAIALKLAEEPPITLMVAKGILNMTGEGSLEGVLTAESMGFGLLFSTKDSREGIKAFLEKRQPKYQGK
ncbi:3-hydroxyacyl-CoA dehydrogenase/enoyl-CoA hydratase family protein [Caldivirga maquilingensis]|uniref:3-hydroxyacyl-CoA dehydrogenase NAD-binding n=1 Tax=Caldivirga maquilingensis (strain ATCC 700844 / DSM 13496 / JCM 10307 / IC-167) TaxID=397948 RepID=A8MB93_CALMQ|nr:3-hydroxyacyl-CoA dehydrogenase/enoyl-CoA hydratase family protein [Caldivirga maquilingensis]ABW01183.1 3-hydroxyacyl-CoA dehydrogenase NAD-binding [Caldivirga maquilingensis IC-167]